MPMLNQVLIVATEPVARTPARIAQSLSFNPVVAASEEEAIALLDAQPFSLVAVGDDAIWQRMREVVEARQPMTRVLRLPESNGDPAAVRQLLTRYLEPPHLAEEHFSEERYQFLSHVLESFTTTLDLKEVVRRIVTMTREEFGADRAYLLQSVTEESEFAKVAFACEAPGIDKLDHTTIPLKRSQGLIKRAMESPQPTAVAQGDPDLDTELATLFGIRSQLVQILPPRDGEPWEIGRPHV